MLPRVTVCVPVQNGGRTIQRTLRSILGQTYPNVEVIVSDNCSTDDTARIVQGFAEQGVAYYLNPRVEKCGESNWNYVLSLARSPFIAIYHADDLYMPTMVQRQLEFLQAHPNVSAVFVMTRRIDDWDRPIRMGETRLPAALQGEQVFDFPTLLNAVLADGNFMVVPTMMAREEALRAVGGFRWEEFGSASDVDLILRMAKWGPIGVIDEPLHRYRVSTMHGSFLWSRRRTDLADIFGVLEAYLAEPCVQTMVEPQARALYGMQRAADQVLCAMNLLAQGKTDEARPLLGQALKARHFGTALKRPRLFARMVVGTCFRVGLYLGLGQWLGRSVQRAYELDLRRRLSPVNG